MIRDKIEVMDIIKKNKIISIIRTDNFEKALKSAVAIIDGGIRVLEFSYTMSFAGELITELTQKYKNTDVLIGAGTVLDLISNLLPNFK